MLAHHGIDTLLLWHLGEVEQAGAVGKELAVKEGVHQVHLAYHVHQAEQLAEEVPVHVHVVRLEGQNGIKKLPVGVNMGLHDSLLVLMLRLLEPRTYYIYN